MNIVDFILLVIFIGALIRGYRLGLIRQFIHFLGFFIAIYIAYQFSGELTPLLKNVIPSPDFEKSSLYLLTENFQLENMFYNALSFFIIFIAAKILLSVAGYFLDTIFNLPGLAIVNRFSGALVGIVQAALIVIILVHFISVMPWQNLHAYLYGSTIASYLLQFTPIITETLYQFWNSSNFI